MAVALTENQTLLRSIQHSNPVPHKYTPDAQPHDAALTEALNKLITLL